MERLTFSSLKYVLIPVIFIFILSSCNKEEMVVPVDKPVETIYSLNPDDLSISADSPTRSMLDSSQSLGYTYSSVISVSAQVQMNLAGSLTAISDATNKISRTQVKEDQKKRESFFTELWHNITGLLL